MNTLPKKIKRDSIYYRAIKNFKKQYNNKKKEFEINISLLEQNIKKKLNFDGF